MLNENVEHLIIQRLRMCITQNIEIKEKRVIYYKVTYLYGVY